MLSSVRGRFFFPHGAVGDKLDDKASTKAKHALLAAAASPCPKPWHAGAKRAACGKTM